MPFEIEAVEQDIGCIQDGPLHIEVEKTWQAYRDFHRHWDQRLADETKAIRRRAPCFVLSDISYLAIEAGAAAGIPTVALSSLSWDIVLEGLRESQEADPALIRRIAAAYGRAGVMVRLAPGLRMPAFQRVIDVGPIVEEVTSNRQAIREVTDIRDHERLVVIGFGGIPLTSLPWHHVDGLQGYRFVIPGPVPPGTRRMVSADALPVSFRAIMAAADVLVTKPGYASIVEAVARGTPVVYVRRYNFADEGTLVEYVHRYGRGVELSFADFSQGRWRDALMRSIMLSPPPEWPPPPAGQSAAARLLVEYLERRG